MFEKNRLKFVTSRFTCGTIMRADTHLNQINGLTDHLTKNDLYTATHKGASDD